MPPLPNNPFFLPYQRRWLEDPARIKIMVKSRQIGISWTTAYGLVRDLTSPATRFDAWVSSRDELQARLFLQDVRAFASILDQAAHPYGHHTLDPAQSPGLLALTLANGRRIHCLSSNPNAQAGKRGPRVLDEFALHPHPKRLYAIATPGLTWGGTLAIISTHRGSHNFFHTLVEQARQDPTPHAPSIHTVTLPDAIRDGLLDRLQPRLAESDPRKHLSPDDFLQFTRNSCPDEETWQQEYLCQPADDHSAFLPTNLIAGCHYAAGENWQRSPAELPAHALLTLGVDIGRTHDLTAFALLEHPPTGPALLRSLKVYQNIPFAEQEATLHTYLQHPGLHRACIDATGLGRQFAERAASRYGAHRIEGLHLTAPLKEALAYPLRAALENRALRLPDDPALHADLRSIRRTPTAAGHLRFAADHSPHGHADRFWALALALYAHRDPPITPYHIALSRNPSYPVL